MQTLILHLKLLYTSSCGIKMAFRFHRFVIKALHIALQFSNARLRSAKGLPIDFKRCLGLLGLLLQLRYPQHHAMRTIFADLCTLRFHWRTRPRNKSSSLRVPFCVNKGVVGLLHLLLQLCNTRQQLRVEFLGCLQCLRAGRSCLLCGCPLCVTPSQLLPAAPQVARAAAHILGESILGRNLCGRGHGVLRLSQLGFVVFLHDVVIIPPSIITPPIVTFFYLLANLRLWQYPHFGGTCLCSTQVLQLTRRTCKQCIFLVTKPLRGIEFVKHLRYFFACFLRHAVLLLQFNCGFGNLAFQQNHLILQLRDFRL